ncbi:hypothetical protein FG379_000244 [Cryptosporidium bovis]|uniref:uncharacterized protein n=1 Tax=Cryptosporidium bovis TaxID=310047 RepID=UPI003519EBC6|nr:hypothetical protein FG379_000244 [Cryptosporidium bovis]
MIINESNLDKLLELRRNIEYLMAEVEHRCKFILNNSDNGNDSSDSLTLGNIAYLGLRYSSTTKAPPNYNDLTGRELSRTPSYRFPFPTTALIQLSQLYNAKPVMCMKPKIVANEISFDTKIIEISCLQKGVEIIYQINNSGEQYYFEPFHIKGPGEYNIIAFSKKNGFRNSNIDELHFTIYDNFDGINTYLPSVSPDTKLNATINAENDLITINNMQDATIFENKNIKRQHSHTSKYKGLHLTRAPAFSDDSDGEDSDEDLNDVVEKDNSKDSGYNESGNSSENKN